MMAMFVTPRRAKTIRTGRIGAGPPIHRDGQASTPFAGCRAPGLSRGSTSSGAIDADGAIRDFRDLPPLVAAVPLVPSSATVASATENGAEAIFSHFGVFS